MAIIIPSSNIYDSNNNKIIDNKINGVSYSKIAVEDKQSDLWTAISISASATETTSISYGDYDEVSSTIRKRVKVEKTTQQRRITMSGYTPPIDINWDKVYWEFRQNLTDNLAGNTSINELVVPNNISSPPAVPSFNIGNEALISYAKQLWKYGFDANITEGTSPTAFIYCYSHIILSIVTETRSSGRWLQTKTEKVYDTFATLYSGNTNRPVLRFYIDNSYDVKSTITVGNSKSAYSLPSNDLFTNTATVSNQKLGDYVAEQIIAEYENGKEMATLLCSISNYYDEFGNQAKFDDGENMTFQIYDVVVPFVYDYMGRDVPMSLSKNGNAKTFVVVGIELFYDGAVWQRLTLQEFGEGIEFKVALPTPRISLNGSVLTISNYGEANLFDIYINGTLNSTINSTEFDISELNLDFGEYRFYVIGKSSKYLDSAQSNIIEYIKKSEQLIAPIISITNDVLTINDSSGLAQTFDVYANGIIIKPDLTETTLDLSTLNLGNGTHSIYVISKSTNFDDSEASNVETYIIEPPIIKAGTYVVNETPNITKDAYYSAEYNNSDISTHYYTYFGGEDEYLDASDVCCIYFYSTNGITWFNSGGIIYTRWKNGIWEWSYPSIDYAVQRALPPEPPIASGAIPEQYLQQCRTLTIKANIEVSRDFRKVFMDNVKRVIEINIGGAWFSGLEGMTWAEWCNSGYNTLGIYCSSDRVVYNGDILFAQSSSGWTQVLPTEEIKASVRYDLA